MGTGVCEEVRDEVVHSLVTGRELDVRVEKLGHYPVALACQGEEEVPQFVLEVFLRQQWPFRQSL